MEAIRNMGRDRRREALRSVVLRRGLNETMLFDRNEYAIRALLAGVEADKVQQIFELSATALSQLQQHAKARRGY
jgi:hypothetical protein